MTPKEEKRLGLVRLFDKRRISLKEASRRMNVSPRQVLRITKNYRLEGEKGIISKHRGRKSPRRLPQEIRSQVIVQARTFLPTIRLVKLRKKLEEGGLFISKETIRRFLIEEGLWTPRKRGRLRRRATLG